MNDGKKWDRYITMAQKYIETGNLDSDEINYKREIGKNTTEACRALLDNDVRWVELLKKALRPNHPVSWRALYDFNQWCRQSQVQASEALKAIWSEPDSTLPVTERIRSFSERLPQSVIPGKRSRGTRTTIASALLMGLDVEQYPPFAITLFEKSYERIGYHQPEAGAPEEVLYKHALDFLDEFIKKAGSRGLELDHRLAAQSIVWALHQGRDQNTETSGPQEEDTPSDPQPSDLQELADELLLRVDFLEEIETLLAERNQIIFQGPPGTGKTYVAQKLARHLAESKDHVTLVQFHPSYAYEDFVRGFRPTLETGQAGFKLQDGALLLASQQARNEPNAKHFLIIDEINRGNLAKVFGELYFLLEYRDEAIRLQYQEEGERNFSLPKNLYIIGTMNTADRSIALVDLALRRRFYFVDFHPDKEPVKGVLSLWLEKNVPHMEWIASVVVEANELLKNERHAAIGPSYFIKDGLDKEKIRRIWQHSVLPYIQERLFGDDERIKQFELKELCRKVAPHITWDENEVQNDEDSGSSVSGHLDSVNNATDQPTGISAEQAIPSDDR